VRRLTILVGVVGIVLLGATGCIQTQVTRSIQIHKDVNGRVTGFTEIESTTQMRWAAFKLSGFEYLKAGPGEAEPLKLYGAHSVSEVRRAAQRQDLGQERGGVGSTFTFSLPLRST
jgi:hypothetical protein